MSSSLGSCAPPPARWWPINLAHMALPAANIRLEDEDPNLAANTQRPKFRLGRRHDPIFDHEPFALALRIAGTNLSGRVASQSFGNRGCFHMHAVCQDWPQWICDDSRCMHPMSARFAISCHWPFLGILNIYCGPHGASLVRVSFKRRWKGQNGCCSGPSLRGGEYADRGAVETMMSAGRSIVDVIGPGVNRDVHVNVQGPSCLSGCYVVDPCIDLKGKSGIWSTQYVGVVWATTLRSPSKKTCIYFILFIIIYIYIYNYICIYLYYYDYDYI